MQDEVVYMEIFLAMTYIFTEIIKTSIIMFMILGYEFTKKTWKYVICIPALILIIIAVCSLGYGNFETHTLLLLIITMLVMIFIFQEKMHRILFAYIPVYLGASSVDIFCAKIIAALFTDSAIELSNSVWHLLYNLIGMLLICIFAVLFKWINRKKRRTRLTKEWVLLIMGVLLCDVLALGYSELRMGEDLKHLKVFSILFAGACMTVIIGICAIITLLDSREIYMISAEYNEKLLHKQLEYYHKTLLQDERIIRFRHDYKNHIRCLRVLMESGNMEQLKDYMYKMDETVSTNIYKYNVGNDLVNCILSNIEKDYELEGIQLRIEGYFPAEMAINNIDLSIIISNAVLNAFEATQSVHIDLERTIHFNIKSINQILYIEIINPINSKISINNGMIENIKDNKGYHGFGIRNMRDCIKKYNGYLKYSCTENEIMTKIIISNINNK